MKLRNRGNQKKEWAFEVSSYFGPLWPRGGLLVLFGWLLLRGLITLHLLLFSPLPLLGFSCFLLACQRPAVRLTS